MRQLFWPRTGWGRAMRYIGRRILRLSATPRSIALGLSVGVFVSALPFLGIHTALAIGITWVLRGNIVASVIGTAVGNPLTFPLLWLASFRVGRFVLDYQTPITPPPPLSFSSIIDAPMATLLPILVPMSVGGLLIGLGLGLAAYYPSYFLVFLYQKRRAWARTRRHHKLSEGHDDGV